ncbi:MAG: NADH-quinone oxidoreductase subunit J [Elusimicrobia bacterium]|nr:NADH-quinone oxidoreductase subunit J [Candidatus Obscuribacterium magneticum]
MTVESILFYLLSATVIIPALMVVSVRNVFHAALWLVVSLLGVGGIYALLAADFLFAVQLMVYAGGVMVVILFVILISDKPSDWMVKQINDQVWLAVLVALLFVSLLVLVIGAWPSLGGSPFSFQPTTGNLGSLLLGAMVLPFEVVAVVLMVALIGAVYFSMKKIS